MYGAKHLHGGKVRILIWVYLFTFSLNEDMPIDTNTHKDMEIASTHTLFTICIAAHVKSPSFFFAQSAETRGIAKISG